MKMTLLAIAAPLLLAAGLAGCAAYYGEGYGGGYVSTGVAYEPVPVLPPVVEFEEEPFIVSNGFVYYYDRDGDWHYSRGHDGRWHDLPRDRYPREVRTGRLHRR